MRILISILSKYLQPNFLLIKEMRGRYDRLMFVTTEFTDKNNKTEHLCKALGISVNEVGLVSLGDKETNYREIVALLEQQNFSKTDEYILNLTGGTKIIPIAIFEFFMNNGYNADFFYVPESKNVVKNVSSGEECQLGYKLNLKEYFALQGLQFCGNNNLFKSEVATNNLLAKYRSALYDKSGVAELRDCQLLTTSEKKRYFGGEWFEEYCFIRLKREFAIPDDCIIKSAKIYKNNPNEQNNEADVMFVKDNQLYMFECKVIRTDWDSRSVEPYLYKLAAITKNYGLKVRSYLFTLCDMDRKTKKYEMLVEKLNVLGIKVFGYQDFEKQTILL